MLCPVLSYAVPVTWPGLCVRYAATTLHTRYAMPCPVPQYTLAMPCPVPQYTLAMPCPVPPYTRAMPCPVPQYTLAVPCP
eukprot:723269-Rhodomonas_salina.1